MSAEWGNYVIVNPSHWGNFLIADKVLLQLLPKTFNGHQRERAFGFLFGRDAFRGPFMGASCEKAGQRLENYQLEGQVAVTLNKNRGCYELTEVAREYTIQRA
ncbi:MAG TPA: hypothetical protein VFN75_09005 [Pseudonocardiaceae bacterium]|nr:hypothetical protein [Pseudonocardiaceae bacterium]